MDTEPSLADQLRDAERRIGEHPGYQEYLEVEALGRSIGAVFIPNRDELLSLLEAASTDWRLAFELIQNVREPTVRKQFHVQLTRHLHNYLASAASLRDHVRRLMKDRSGPIVDEFQQRKRIMLRNPEVPFVFDLRNYLLHRKLPFFAHTLSMTNVNQPDQEMASEVELNVAELLAWDGWSSAAHDYLASSGDAVAIRPVITTHARLVLDLNSWLLGELTNANASALDEVNELIVARNTILTSGDTDAARRMAQGEDA